MPSRLWSSWPFSMTEASTSLRTIGAESHLTKANLCGQSAAIGCHNCPVEDEAGHVDTDALGVFVTQGDGACSRIDHHVHRHGIDVDSRFEMAAAGLVKNHLRLAVDTGGDHRPPGNQSRCQSRPHRPEVIPIKIAGDERQYDEYPQHQLSSAFSEGTPACQNAGGKHDREGKQADEAGEVAIGHSEAASAILVQQEYDKTEGKYGKDDDEAHQPFSRSRVIRARRVSRRGLRSTVSSRAGKPSMMERRS